LVAESDNHSVKPGSTLSMRSPGPNPGGRGMKTQWCVFFLSEGFGEWVCNRQSTSTTGRSRNQQK